MTRPDAAPEFELAATESERVSRLSRYLAYLGAAMIASVGLNVGSLLVQWHQYTSLKAQLARLPKGVLPFMLLAIGLGVLFWAGSAFVAGVLGARLLNASRGFRACVETQGQDRVHLGLALSNLLELLRLKYWLVLATCALWIATLLASTFVLLWFRAQV